MRRLGWAPIAGALALLAGILLLPMAARAASSTQSTNPPPVAVDHTLENMTYQSEYTDSGEVTLENGIYEDADTKVYVMLANAPRAYGDVDGDGDLDAVVWMATNTGGSGVFVDLAVVLDVEGDATNVATTFLGDRAQIQAIEIADDGTITVRMINHSDDDPMCCPTQHVEMTFALQGDEIVTLSEEVISADGDEMVTPEPAAGSTPVAGGDASAEETPEPAEEPEVAATPDPFATPWANPFADGVLENATYQTEYFESGEVTLEDGQFTDDVNHISYYLLPQPRAYGDLDGDGDGDAVVLLAGSFGGSGTFVSMHAVINEDGAANNSASLVLGDRVQPKSLSISPDGVIELTVVTHDADDPMCCPTLEVTQQFILEGDTLVIAPEQPKPGVGANGEVTDPGEGNVNLFDPDGDPTVATIALGAPDALVPNPALVSLIAGPGDDTAVDALPLDPTCTGWVSTNPNIVVNLGQNENEVRFFTVGDGDPTLVVVTPDGDILCNDDMQAEVLNPLVIVPEAPAGRYAIYAGVFDTAAAQVTSMLVATTLGYDPSTFSVAITATALSEVSGVGASGAETATLAIDASQATTITVDDLPFAAIVNAGGEVNVFETDLGNSLCTGWTSVQPALNFTLDADQADAETLVLYFEGTVDTTLIVRDPAGDYVCGDDSAEDTNINPLLNLPFTPGEYGVWVGTYNGETSSAGTLTITNDPSATPALLERQ